MSALRTSVSWPCASEAINFLYRGDWPALISNLPQSDQGLNDRHSKLKLGRVTASFKQ